MKQNNVVKTVLIEESAGVQSCRKGFPETTTSSSRKLREEKNTRTGNQGPRSTDGTESRRLSLCARGASTSNSPSRPLPFPPRCILFIPRPRTWFSLRPLEASEARMVNYDSGANHPETPQPGFLSRYVFSTNHKTIGLNYLWLALFSVFLGMAMSLLMRIHFVWPGAHLPFLSSLGNSPDRFAALTTLHGSLMVFLVLTAAPQAGFGNYFLPLQIGAREVAFPTLNLLAFWATVASFVGLTGAFLISPHSGITLWIVSVAIFCAASLCNALNFSVTTIDLRAQGMTLPRLPLTVWAWFINAILGMLIFSILLAACLCLLSDRLLSTHFFPPLYLLASQPGAVVTSAVSILWQRLFWFFAQAEVYIAMLPCFGLVTHLISTFSRKPVWKERLVVLALCGVGVFGFCVWGQHMFSSGMNPFSPLVFSLLASFHFFSQADSPAFSSPAKISPPLPSATISSPAISISSWASRPRSQFLAHCFSGSPNFSAAA